MNTSTPHADSENQRPTHEGDGNAENSLPNESSSHSETEAQEDPTTNHTQATEEEASTSAHEADQGALEASEVETQSMTDSHGQEEEQSQAENDGALPETASEQEESTAAVEDKEEADAQVEISAIAMEVVMEEAPTTETTAEAAVETPASETSAVEINTEENAIAEEETNLPVFDFGAMSIQELKEFIEKAIEFPDEKNIGRLVGYVKAEFNNRMATLREQALAKWEETVAEIPEEERPPFEYQEPEERQIFNALHLEFKRKRIEYIEKLNNQKIENASLKRKYIEEIKALTENPIGQGVFEQFRNLQEQYRQVGSVPIDDREGIYQSYRVACDRFFEQRHLLAEFRELDQKKNLDAKTEIIQRIKGLHEVESIEDAMKSLKQLQEEWSHMGPVPRANHEELIAAYKEAVQFIYDKRTALNKEFQVLREKNYEAKLEILEKIREISEFRADKHQAWIQKNEELAEWIKNWKAIGPTSLEHNEALRAQFSEYVKNFNHAKNEHFKDRKKAQSANLQKKIELCEKVEAILASDEDLGKHRQEVILFQTEWKEIGPTPPKTSDKVWARFRGACDQFFAKADSIKNERIEKEQANLKAKEEVILKAEAMAELQSIEGKVRDHVRNLQAEFNAIGFVPFKQKDAIRNRFNAATQKLMEKFGVGREGQAGAGGIDHYKDQLQDWATESEFGAKRIDQDRMKYQREMSKIENEISTLENNMAFFKNSKGADAFKQGIMGQIEGLQGKLKQVKEKLDAIKNLKSGN